MSDEHGSRRPIVVRRHKRHAQHSSSHGTWKIAYADFMTAMMAFFLVMWLLGGLSNIQIAQVSQYFRTPLKVALVGGDQATASDSAIPGGGDNVIHSDGAVALTTPDAANYRSSKRSLEGLKKQLEAAIKQDPALNAMSSQLKVQLVPDGLQIQISDSKRKPMFQLGSARLEPYIRTLIQKIAPQINTVPNRITLTGHTDDLSYTGGGHSYSNWELSADRANAARRALMAGGMQTHKLLRVIGAADTVALADNKPGAPVNRRISILILNEQAERRIEGEAEVEPSRQSPSRPPLQTQDSHQSLVRKMASNNGSLTPADWRKPLQDSAGAEAVAASSEATH